MKEVLERLPVQSGRKDVLQGWDPEALDVLRNLSRLGDPRRTPQQSDETTPAWEKYLADWLAQRQGDKQPATAGPDYERLRRRRDDLKDYFRDRFRRG